MSKPTRTTRRAQPNRAALKAYEARRAEEIARVGAAPAGAVDIHAPEAVNVQRGYMIGRALEIATIRSDLRRLLMIVVVEIVVLVALTLILR